MVYACSMIGLMNLSLSLSLLVSEDAISSGIGSLGRDRIVEKTDRSSL